MQIRIVRKAIGLLLADIVIIIGIFVLQFRTDSSIIEKIGNLQITLATTENDNNVSSLKNKLQLAYNGINFYCDDQNPAKVVLNDNTKKDVQLLNWTKKHNSCEFDFSDEVSVVFALSSDSPDASLSVTTNLPSDVKSFLLPYKINYNMKIQKENADSVILAGKKLKWELAFSGLKDGFANFNREDSSLSYYVYDDSHSFTFESITDLASASSGSYELTRFNFKSALINAYEANTSESYITEQIAVSYVACQAEKGSYTAAVEEIPQSVKKSKQRTYLSAPYFNNLEDMNVTLDQAVKNSEQLIAKTLGTSSLNLFTVRNIANFLCIYSNKDTVRSILAGLSAQDLSGMSVSEATGILEVYVDLKKLQPDYAELLLPVLDTCVSRIERACSFDGNALTITENDTFLSVIQAVETGVALIRYGETCGNETLLKSGRVIVNSYMQEAVSFDLRTLSNLYPIVAYDNWYYPHFAKINTENDSFYWAWTCAKDITYSKDAEGSVTLSVNAPIGETHYIILKGIPPFVSIYIYNIAFRTDPRFETYNSSGYVYKNDSRTLLLKSRHKSQLETVKFEYFSRQTVTVDDTSSGEKSSESEEEEITATDEAKTQAEILGAE